jgi:hypothetical protein
MKPTPAMTNACTVKIIVLNAKEVMWALNNHLVLSALSTATLYEYMVNRHFKQTEEYYRLLIGSNIGI